MFDTIKKLRPHFFSLREIDKTVSLDIKLPLIWGFDSTIEKFPSVKIKIQDKNDKFSLVSLVSHATSDGYDAVFNCGLDIIEVNKEMEEKKRLFEEKVSELRVMFEKESLNKLKEIKFKKDEEHEEFPSLGDGENPTEEGVVEGQDRD